MLKQLSIYAENKKGVMQNITGILKNEDINILGSEPMTVQSTESYEW